MNKLQYDSFYKFIVSIGTLLIAAPVLGIYYLFTGSYDILISEQEYLDLSQISLESLHSREKLMNIIFTALPYVFFGLIAIGLFCVIWGGIKWYNIQKTLDESIQLDVDEKRFNFKKLTASEIVEKAVKEVIEVQGVSDITNLSEQKQRIFKGLQIESDCFNYLSKKLSKNYKVQQNVKVGDNEYDIIAISKRDNVDFIYEIKYWSNPRAANIIARTLHGLKRAGIDYEENVHRDFRLKLIIVTTAEQLDSFKGMFSEYLQKSDETFSNIDIECLSEEELKK